MNGAGHDPGCPHGEGGGGGNRSRYATRQPDPQRNIVSIGVLNPIAYAADGRKQRHSRSIVGMPARIRLGGYVLGDRNLRRKGGLFLGDVAGSHQLAEQVLGRGGEKFRRQFFP